MLGPVRFTHIEVCAREVCRTFKAVEEVEACIEELKELDESISQKRAELATLPAPDDTSQPNATTSLALYAPTRIPDYSKMLLNPPDVNKAKRLIVARQNTMKSVSSILERTKSRSIS